MLLFVRHLACLGKIVEAKGYDVHPAKYDWQRSGRAPQIPIPTQMTSFLMRVIRCGDPLP